MNKMKKVSAKMLSGKSVVNVKRVGNQNGSFLYIEFADQTKCRVKYNRCDLVVAK